MKHEITPKNQVTIGILTAPRKLHLDKLNNEANKAGKDIFQEPSKARCATVKTSELCQPAWATDLQ